MFILYQFLSFPSIVVEGGRRNSLENHFTSSDSSRVQISSNLKRRPALKQKFSSSSSRPTSSNCTLDVKEEKTFLWRIDTFPPSYFFGTIHVPYTRVWDAVSENTKKAFQVSQDHARQIFLMKPLPPGLREGIF